MNLILVAWLLFLAGSLTGLAGRSVAFAGRRVGALLQALGCIALAWAGSHGMGGIAWESTPLTIPHIGTLILGMDRLTGIFMLMLGIVGFSSCLFAVGYLDHLESRWNFHWLPLMTGLFLFSMSGVFLARHVLVFLFFWELMALSSFVLVILESWSERQRRTGFMYLTITHAGAAFLFMGLLWPVAGSGAGYSFSAWTQGLALMSPFHRWMVFGALMIGFATKAGMIPLHVWLPRAHPQAPAHVSALMSGVMIKTGIYGLLRFFLTPLLPNPMVWGTLLLGLGIVSALVGVLYAMYEENIKSLLAYSSIENIGIICLGIGMGLIFRASGMEPQAITAFAAALVHSFNHALFKGLLFLGAGAIHERTHTGNLDELGGLARTMPILSGLFFIGALAISALPPTNGFAGEWLIYRSLIAGFALPHLTFKLLTPLLAALLALAGALAAACFVKAFGCIFLGRTRNPKLHVGSEPALPILYGMGLPALLCLMLGALPDLIITPATAAIGGVARWKNMADTLPTLAWPAPTGSEGVEPLLIFSLLALGILLAFRLLQSQRRAGPGTESGDTWNCGTPLTARMSYSASGFAEPFLVNFAALFAPRRSFRTLGPNAPLLPARMTYVVSVRKIFEEYLYKPVLGFLLWLSHRFQHLQAGSLQVYLFLMFIVLIGLLALGR